MAQGRLGGLVKILMPGREPPSPVSEDEIGRGVELVPFHLDVMNETFGGIPRGGFCVIAGRPGMGKSSMAEDIVIEWLRPDGKRDKIDTVFFCGLEMGWRRHAASIRRRIKERDLPFKATDLNIVWVEVGRSGDNIARHIIHHGRGEKKAAVVVDFIQELSEGTGSRKEQIDRSLLSLKPLGSDFGMTNILLSQMNRGIEDKRNPRIIPTMSDMEHTGRIEQMADIIIVPIRRSILAGKAGQEIEACKAYAIKNREGSMGAVDLIWNGPKRTFEERRNDPFD